MGWQVDSMTGNFQLIPWHGLTSRFYDRDFPADAMTWADNSILWLGCPMDSMTWADKWTLWHGLTSRFYHRVWQVDYDMGWQVDSMIGMTSGFYDMGWQVDYMIGMTSGLYNKGWQMDSMTGGWQVDYMTGTDKWILWRG
jgi:hypothetical protein